MSPEQANSQPANIDPTIEEQLVAYLDGELDTEGSLRIEELLATDPKVRQALQRLDGTWELLDELDASPTSDASAQSTLEMVTVAAAADAEQDRASAPRRCRRRWLAVATGLAVAGLAGYLSAAWLKPDPDAELVRRLPVIEYLEHYRLVDGVEILRLLSKEDLFDGSEAAIVAEESPAQRRRRLEEMSPAQQADLRHLVEHFEFLKPEERQQVQRLHDQIASHAQAAQLRRTMVRYTEWLKSLPPYRRDEVQELPPSERVERIRELIGQETLEGLARHDVEALIHWTKNYVESHEEAILPTLPEPLRERMADLTASQRQVWLTWLMWQRWQWDRGWPLNEQDVVLLRGVLSEPAQEQLQDDSATNVAEVLAGWTRTALRGPTASEYFRAGLDSALQQQLDQFFEQELTDTQRDRLLSLPGDEMLRELRRMYFGLRFSETPNRRPPGPRGPQRGRP